MARLNDRTYYLRGVLSAAVAETQHRYAAGSSDGTAYKSGDFVYILLGEMERKGISLTYAPLQGPRPEDKKSMTTTRDAGGRLRPVMHEREERAEVLYQAHLDAICTR